MKTLWIVLIIIGILALAVFIWFAWIGLKIKKAKAAGKAQGIADGERYLAEAKAAKQSKMPKKFRYQGGGYNTRDFSGLSMKKEK